MRNMPFVTVMAREAPVLVVVTWEKTVSASQTTTQKAIADEVNPGQWKVLKPRKGLQMIDFARLWQFRELLGMLALRDVKVRYKQTALGAAWAIIQPVTMMVVMSLFFGRFAKMNEQVGSVPYPIFLYAALLPWTFFASSVTASTNSMVVNSRMLTKIFFPRLIVPFAATGTPLVDYAMAFIVLLALMVWYSVSLSWQLLLLPALVGLTIISAMGVGLILAAVTVRFRDFRYLVPFMIQVWFFITPVIYPNKMVPENWQWLIQLNPMCGIIEAFRASVLGTAINWSSLGMSTVVALVGMAIGLLYFNQAQRKFADVI
ncbi:MAG: phosphate ABC transporter permease [Phycisphaeraceae bacterium]|nr:phosphate ABC transporter permease [Phycisphaeraceae bacterium]